MPSANAEDPIIVKTPSHRGLVDRCLRALTVFLLVVLLAIGGGLLLLYTGAFDGQMASRAQSLLQGAVGDQMDASVGHSGLRIARRGLLALQVDDVALSDADGGETVLRAERVVITLRMRPLLSGQFNIGQIAIEGGYIDANRLRRALFDNDPKRQIAPFEIAQLDQAAGQALQATEILTAVLKERGIRRIRLTDTAIDKLGAGENQASAGAGMTVEMAELTQSNRSGLTLDAELSYAEQSIRISSRVLRDEDSDNRYKLTANITGLNSGKLIKEITRNPRRKFRMESDVDIDFTALGGTEGQAPELSADLRLSAGELVMDGLAAQIEPSTIDLVYDAQRKSLEIERSNLKIGASSYAFHGGIIDLVNLPADKNPNAKGKRGFAFDLIVDEAIVAPMDSSEPPVKVAMKAFARLVSDDKRLYIDDFVVSSASGSMFSSVSIEFSDTSPEVSFVANINKMDTGTVKQLWPYWIAKMARRWVHENLFGGTVTGGKISVFIPEGRMAAGMTNGLNLDGQQLQIDFNLSDARFDVAGDIPAVRDAHGLFSLRGKHLELKIDGGTSYFPSGRNVAVSNGLFVIDDTDAHPLTAQLDIDVAGDASAVAELISFKPIDALRQTPWKAEDFEGPVRSKVNVSFGLIQEQNPPSPVWDVELDLDGVSIGPKVDGMKVTDAKGKLHVDTQTIKIDTQALLNGMQATIDFTEPLDSTSKTDSVRVVKLSPTDADREQFAPQLNEYVSGTVYLTTKLGSRGSMQIDADLTEARLILPWIGWSKGKGIKATASFDMVPSEIGNQVASAQSGTASDAAEAGFGLPSAFEIRNLVVEGEGITAKGNLHFAGGEITQAKLEQVSLSRNDSFSVDLEKKSGTYVVNIAGRAVDLRSSIKHLMSESEVAEIGEDVTRLELKVRAGEAHGFNGQTVQEFKLDYSGHGETILALDLSAVTAESETVTAVGKHGGSGLTLSLNSNDAGNLARFTDIYPKLQGGTLDVQLAKADNGPYIGTVDLSNFSVVEDEHLKSLVLASPNGGESLDQVTRRKIDVSRAQFQQASARIDKGKGYLRVEDGIARGNEVGLAFQGTVFDGEEGMNITGTFMPAYGLNRIFGEIPVLGAILGNGRDRGLIGITFRLYGSLEDPQLQVNPISLIAPGIFRSIFQFRSDVPVPERAPSRPVVGR